MDIRCSMTAIAVLFFSMLSNVMIPEAAAFPGKGSGGIEFDPASDTEDAQCLNLFGIDLNALFGVSEPFVNRACHEVPTGSFYVANNHVIVNTEYPEDLREQLEAENYAFLGATPAEDFLMKLEYIRFEVRNEQSGKVRYYEFSPEAIVNTWDHINDDPLVCSDFFPACIGVGAPASSPMLAFIPKLPPLPPGSYAIDMYYNLSEPFNSGFGIGPSFPYNFSAGEALVFPNFLTVVKNGAAK